MAQRPLEKIVGKRPEEFKFGTKDAMFYYLAELYDESLMLNECEHGLQIIYKRELGNLKLPKKISFFGKLKSEGKKAIKEGNIGSGAYYLGISHYFWQNFVVMERAKGYNPKI